MKRALCIAVSIAVMVVFSFADVMAVTKAPSEEPDATVPEAIATEEPAEEASDDVVVGEPSEEGTDADAEGSSVEEPAVIENSTVDTVVSAKEIDKVALSYTVDDAKVDLTWSPTGSAEGVKYDIYQDETLIVEDYDGKAYSVTGLTNGKTYKFKVVAKYTVMDDSAEPPAEKTVKKESNVVAASPGIGNITNLKAGADSSSVDLTWTAVKNADGYIVYKNGKQLFNDSDEVISYNEPKTGTVYWRVSARERKGTTLPTYDFAVEAFRYKDKARPDMKNILKSPIVKKENCYPIRAFYVTFTPKKSGHAYKSAKGKKKGMKLKKGKKYIAKGFVCSRFRVCKNDTSAKVNFYPRVLGKNIKMKYSTKIKYSPKEAENFVNHKGIKSGSKCLVWISLYTQHVYFFKGSKGKWKIYEVNGKPQHWEVSTGKVMSATATGTWKIFRHWKHRRGLSYWSNFYSQVAMHSWGNPSCFGVPHSGGCVRMTKSQAKWVYNKMPMKTTVYVY